MPSHRPSTVGGVAFRVSYRGRSEKDERGVTWYAVSDKGKNGWVSSRYARIK